MYIIYTWDALHTFPVILRSIWDGWDIGINIIEKKSIKASEDSGLNSADRCGVVAVIHTLQIYREKM